MNDHSSLVCHINLANGFIGIIPNHPIMKNCIDKIVDNVLNEKWKMFVGVLKSADY